MYPQHRSLTCRSYPAAGRALLFLAPSERGAMLAQLEAAGVPVTPIRQNPAKVQHVGPALQALCSKSAELKVRITRQQCKRCAGLLTTARPPPCRTGFRTLRLAAAPCLFQTYSVPGIHMVAVVKCMVNIPYHDHWPTSTTSVRSSIL